MLLTSLQNPRIKRVLKLKTSRGRRASHLTLIDGWREIRAAFRSGIDLPEVFVCPEGPPSARVWSLAKQMAKRGSHVFEVTRKVYDKLAYGERQDGLVAVARPVRGHLDDLDFSRLGTCLVLENIEKPGNLGAVLRTCDAAGVDAVLMTGTKTDIYHPNVIRASLGTVFHIPVVSCDAERACAQLKSHGVPIVAAVCQAETLYTDISFRAPVAIVLGSEEKGLSPFWLRHSDHQVRIPMRGSADSLNVSVSAALLVYEALKQHSDFSPS